MAYPFITQALIPVKTDQTPVGGGDDVTKLVQASDWTNLRNNLTDLGNAISAGQFFTLPEQSSSPTAPANYGALLFARANGLASPNLRTQLCVRWSDGVVTVIAESAAR